MAAFYHEIPIAYSTINGLPVIELALELPRTCNWIADVVVDAATAAQVPPGSAASLQMNEGGLLFQGTVYRAAPYAQLTILRLIGGSGLLSTVLEPKFYQGVAAQVVLEDMLAVASEQLSGSSSPAQLNTQLAFWSTLATMPVSMGLSNLCIAVDPDCVWRVLADGTVFFGVDAYPASALVDYDLLDYLPQENKQVIASELPEVFPGESFAGQNVSAVKHHVTGNGNTATVWFGQ